MARPEKITRELIDAICEDISQGFTYDQSALNNGIAASTFYRWMHIGKQSNSDAIYKELVIHVNEASEFSEQEALQLVRSVAKVDRNWKAAAWFLERRFPEKYAKNKNQQSGQENPHE